MYAEVTSGRARVPLTDVVPATVSKGEAFEIGSPAPVEELSALRAPELGKAVTQKQSSPVEIGSATESSGSGYSGFTNIFRGINMGLTGGLAALNFATGNVGLGLLWGACSALWGVALFLGSKD